MDSRMGVLTSLMGSSKASIMATIALLQAFVAQEANLQPATGPVARARNAGTVIAVVVIGLVALVGIMIFSEVERATPQTNTTLDSTSDQIVGGFGDAMGLVPIILLVLLASVVIAVVQRMRA